MQAHLARLEEQRDGELSSVDSMVLHALVTFSAGGMSLASPTCPEHQQWESQLLAALLPPLGLIQLTIDQVLLISIDQLLIK